MAEQFLEAGFLPHIMSFKQHCLEIGIHLLKDDIQFIKAQLVTIPHQLHRPTLEQYVQVWLNAMELCDNDIRKQNAGRFAANSFLRGYHERKD